MPYPTTFYANNKALGTACLSFVACTRMFLNQTSCFSRLDKGLAVLVRERKTDLVIIEGMGRAIHTNYYAALKCESLKLAVIKNSWLADRLGGKIFSVIFKYEVPCK